MVTGIMIPRREELIKVELLWDQLSDSRLPEMFEDIRHSLESLDLEMVWICPGQNE